MPIGKNVGVYRSGALLGVQRQRVKQVSGFDFGAILSANATYAWWADTLPASGATGNWTDYVSGIVATATGAPVVGTLGGQKAALLASGQRFLATITEVAQPFVIITACAPTMGGPEAPWGTSSPFTFCRYLTTTVAISAGATLTGLSFSTSEAHILTTTFNGSSSSSRKNGGAPLTGNAGANVLGASFFIGRRNAFDDQFLGPIALIAIIAPNALITDPALRLADVGARAAAVEAGALIEYSI